MCTLHLIFNIFNELYAQNYREYLILLIFLTCVRKT